MRHILAILLIMLSSCVVHSVDQTAKTRAQKYIEEGVLLLDAKKFDDAEAAFLLALDIELIPEAYDGLGAVFFRRGDYTKAEEIYYKILQWYPDYTHVYGNIALLYEVTDRVHDAKRMYTYAVKAMPENFRVRNNLGALFYSQDEREDGEYTLRQARVLSGNPVVKENIRRTLGDYKYEQD